jgi:ribosomal protein S18 acetylase RimI-like enzyme
MNDIEIVDITPDNIAEYGVCGYKDVNKHLELRKKIDWFKRYYPLGLRIKAVVSKTGGYQGMLEYIPGKYAHRPVEADGYLFIHCIFVGFKKEFKGRGFASALLDECIGEAKRADMLGVAVVTKEGPFMAHNEIFLKKGFKTVARAAPDFDLLALKFNPSSENPRFKPSIDTISKAYGRGLTILRSPQCPYTEKNVNSILDSADNKFKLKTRLVDLNEYSDVQNSPCAFGTFCIIQNGEIISHHPISSTRFENIMNKRAAAGK